MLAKNHEKPILEKWKWRYKILASNALLVVPQELKAWFWSSRRVKNLSPQFFDLDIENPLGRGTLAEFRSSLYLLFLKGISVRPKAKPTLTTMKVALKSSSRSSILHVPGLNLLIALDVQAPGWIQRASSAPTHKWTERLAPVWGSEFIKKPLHYAK
jgi:hypothetical protein